MVLRYKDNGQIIEIVIHVLMGNKESFEARIVYLILSKNPEEALKSLAEFFHVETPRLSVGMPKRHMKDAGCYVSIKKTIFVSNRDNLYNPFVILHEFYHHLRTHNAKHLGTEKYANRFAEEYIEAYKKTASSI